MEKFKYTAVLLLYIIIPASFGTQLFANEKPTLLILGSAHFGNPGRDLVNSNVIDVLSKPRQREIEAVVDQLVEFRPTHVAIEVPALHQSDLDRRYKEYLGTKYILRRNEGDQLGFRVAARLGHDRVHAVDWNGLPPGDTEKDYNWMSYGKSNGHEAAIAKITSPDNLQSFVVELKEQTIGRWLRELNTPAVLQASHRVYFDIATIGNGEKQIGADWVGTWYARNLKIYSRLAALAQNSSDRVLVIFGQGHAYLLTQLAKEHGKFNIKPVEQVLKNDFS